MSAIAESSTSRVPHGRQRRITRRATDLPLSLVVSAVVVVFAGSESVLVAQAVPMLQGVQVAAEVALNGDTFTYSYTLTNGKASSAGVTRLSIDLSQSDGAPVSGTGLSGGRGYLDSIAQEVLSDPNATPMVPAVLG